MGRQRIAIAGGAGFLGQHVSRAMLDVGHEVLNFDLAPSPIDEVQNHIESVFDPAMDETLLKGVDALIHLAWIGKPGSPDVSFSGDADQNVVGSLRLVEAAKRAGVKMVVFASSGGTVYGAEAKACSVESDPLAPINAYGAGKAAFEAYLIAWGRAHGVRTVTLRIANPYGPGQLPDRGQGFIANAIARALDGQALQIWGDGKVVRDYVYIADVAQAFVAALASEDGGVFNIGSGIGWSLNEIVEVVNQRLGTTIAAEHRPGRAIDVPVNVLNSQKAASKLGWRGARPLNAGIEPTASWMSEFLK
ncbi:NAD-dependent epimerase/dehydratase family protein [Maricaulis sp.]|uniref:NAD-dependent epimerase/dehydratase family protein n=1 Tax=Maricaulis sp. TaxID=1486257 RepID=UPI00260E1D9F|nr:NAD-dependent epimerase/dehydratase family protein [Maricaulis sp.]MDF1769367.1 NAD-dependent epimerase/dehydratase family protein [Maricaulis sp.]